MPSTTVSCEKGVEAVEDIVFLEERTCSWPLLLCSLRALAVLVTCDLFRPCAVGSPFGLCLGNCSMIYPYFGFTVTQLHQHPDKKRRPKETLKLVLHRNWQRGWETGKRNITKGVSEHKDVDSRGKCYQQRINYMWQKNLKIVTAHVQRDTCETCEAGVKLKQSNEKH